MSDTGKIIRRRRENPFTQIDNHLLRDDILSWNARGIMAYILSLPDDWEVYKGEIIRHGDIGRDKFNKVWKELQEFGYLTKEVVKNEKTGRIEANVWVINEVPVRKVGVDKPQPKAISTDVLKTRHSVNPVVGKPEYREIRPLTNTVSITNTVPEQIGNADDDNKNAQARAKLNSFDKSADFIEKEFYAGRPLSPDAALQLEAILEQYDPHLIDEAFRRAAAANAQVGLVRNPFAYVMPMFTKWREMGVQTVSEVNVKDPFMEDK